MFAKHTACYLRVSESGRKYSDRLYLVHAYLQFLFDHEDFSLLTATSRRSIARRNARLALASRTLRFVYRCGPNNQHFADRRKVYI